MSIILVCFLLLGWVINLTGGMQIPLHLKTTLLASVVIILVMTITLTLFTSRVVKRLQAEQKFFADAQAESLAERVSDSLSFSDFDRMTRVVEKFDKARTGKAKESNIRIWKVNETNFVKQIETAGENSKAKMPPEVENTLLEKRKAKIIENDSNLTVYRVFVPIIEKEKAVGAVEITESLETFSSLAIRYLLTEFWLAAIFIALSALVIFLLTRHFVYHRLSKIMTTMDRAKAGELDVRVDVYGQDELGLLGIELNRMLAEIEGFSKEREKQNEILAEKVKMATSELAKRNKQLERLNADIWQSSSRLSKLEKLAASGQTAAQFAHEVGTPLNLISGHIQLLRLRTDGDESIRKRLDVIGSQIERIEGIVQSMLDKTRFGDVIYKALDINEVLKSVLELVSPTLEAENISLTKDFCEGLPKIKGNGERLQQVFLNLINNATDAMPEGGKLFLETKKKEDEIVVSIKDTGSGMDKETLQNLFEPLFTTKQRGQGTGLGMVVVRQILDEHNARLDVESELNKGTTFFIYFPIFTGLNNTFNENND